MQLNYNATGKSYLIVGGISTIGQHLISLLVDAGARVYALDIPQAEEKPSTEHCIYIKCNPLELHELKQIATDIATPLSGLICLSGTITHFGTVMDLTIEQWSEVYDISFKSCYNACKAFAPLLQKATFASIVNMSSGLAFGGQAQYGPYTNAKASVISLTKTLATELAPQIRVNAVAPGAVDTAFIYDADGKTRFDKDRYSSLVPLGAMAQPDEIVSVIAFLMSEGASHITGQCIHVNGGAMMM